MSDTAERDAIEDQTKLLLIDLVKDREFLWNFEHDDYKDTVKKNRAFAEIGQELGMSGVIAREVFDQLRGQFKREKKLMDLPSGSKARKKKPWKFYQALTFLSGIVQARPSRGNCPKKPQDSPSLPSASATAEDEDEPTEDTPTEAQETQSDPEIAETPHSSAKVPSRKRPKIQSEVDMLTKEVLSTIKGAKDDEDDLFGMTVAATLRRLPNTTKAMTKAKIMQTLAEAELQAAESAGANAANPDNPDPNIVYGHHGTSYHVLSPHQY